MGTKNGIELDLSKLPQDKNGNILWAKCVGELVPFICNDEVDYLRIVGYLNNRCCRQRVTLEYNNKIRSFHTRDLYYGRIEPLLGVYTQKYIYNVGDYLGKFKIVEQIFITKMTEKTANNQLRGLQERRYRGYLVECGVCGKRYEVKQRNVMDEIVNIKCKCEEPTKEE